ncbi:uncharacterized protein [Antedon mediterranea]|uniref:uncharacterized protein n=1 Tax=Antedon mediterranea TaxID=105859 RepID=UPI003AF6B976
MSSDVYHRLYGLFRCVVLFFSADPCPFAKVLFREEESDRQEPTESSISTISEREEQEGNNMSAIYGSVLEQLTGKSLSKKASSDVFLGANYKMDMSFCIGSHQKAFTGDFNGDGDADLLFHDTTTGAKRIYYATYSGSFTGDQTWKREMSWCHHSGAQLYIGDFNGDDRSDMLCHDTAGKIWISWAQPGGTFIGTPWYYYINWCKSSNEQLFVADFNGDGRDDLLCHTISNGYKTITYAKEGGTFSASFWKISKNWCVGSRQILFTGDFNGDRRADMLCHEDSGGTISVALASMSGTFTGSSSWWKTLNWCKKTNSYTKLRVGDFNKDRRDDIMCTDYSGPWWISYSVQGGSFSTHNWYRKAGWCSYSNQVLIADVNGDGADDLLCYHPSDGIKEIALNRQP